MPPDWVKSTVWPPDVRRLALASLVVSVRVEVPPERILLEERLTRDWDNETLPGVTVAVGRVLVIAAPPIVAENVVAVPEVVPVKVAE